MGMSTSREVQEVIVSALIKNSYLFTTCKDELRDSYFSDGCCRLIYHAVSQYYEKYSNLPNENELLITIDQYYTPQYGVQLNDVKDCCQRLYDYEEFEEEFITDKITDFIRKVKSTDALNNFINQIKINPDLENDQIVRDLADALEVQLSNSKVFRMSDPSQVADVRKEAIGGMDQSKVIHSCIDSVNQCLMFGGYQPGTVNMIVSPPGCFTGDTRIFTTDLIWHTLEELYNKKEKFGVYGYNNNLKETQNEKAESVYLSGYTDELIDVEINGDSYVRCTPDHPFLLVSGDYVEAQSLKEQDLLCGMEFIDSDHLLYDSVVMTVTRITRVKLEKSVPVYGVVNALPNHNYAISLNDDTGVFVSNTGKTMFLINEAVNALRQGFTVLHIFIGDMVEYDGFIRYLSCISGTPQNSLVTMSVEKQNQIVQLCQQQYNNIFNKLFMVSYPSLSLTVDTLIEDVNKYEKQLEVDFDMIIVDYPDNLILDGNSLYSDGGTLYSSLERMARLTKAVVLVASQPQKAYWDHTLIPLEGAAESSKKQMAVDIMLTMNTASRGANYGSMLLAKARKGEVGKVIRYQTDFSKCQLHEIDESTYRALNEENGNTQQQNNGNGYNSNNGYSNNN